MSRNREAPLAALFAGQTLEEIGWHRFARCADEAIDPEIFFPVSTSSTASNAALAVCAQCPVRSHCLSSALRYEERHVPHITGVVGGMTAHDRQRLIKRLIRRRQQAEREAEQKAAAEAGNAELPASHSDAL